MRTRLPVYFLIFLTAFLFCLMPRDSFAEEVARVQSDGVLELRNGIKISLLGIELLPESLTLFSPLLGGKEVDVVYEDKHAEFDGFNPLPAYLYVNTSELSLPFSERVKPEQKRVMINELLLMLGAARVISEGDFRYREEFLMHEEEARQRGEGLWSYADDELLERSAGL